MELRRATDALLRSQVSPFACLFNPTSTTTRWQAGHQLRNTPSSHRNFTNSTKKSAFRPATSTTSAAPKSSSSNSTTDTLNNLTKDLGWGSGTGITMPSKFKPSNGRAGFQNPTPGKSSSDDIINAYNKSYAQKLTPAHQQASSFNFLNSMLDPSDSTKTLGSAVPSDAMDMKAPTPPRVSIRLNPAAGRTVYITTRTDLTKGIRSVDRLCASNRVRQDFTAQRYHERPGLKRKRLRRERWRKNFKASFKATVARVTELKKQGW